MGNNREVWCANTGETVQRTQYYPSGLPWAESTGQDLQNKKTNGKEFVEAHGLDEYDSAARWYYPAIMRTTTIDPLAEKYYSISPYAWCGDNPVNAMDPTGLAWFYYSIDGVADPTWNWRDEDDNEFHTGVYGTNGKEVVLQGYDAVVTADGSVTEHAGANNNLFSKDSELADFTVYGPGGADDIKHYRGLTMTSDFNKYGAVDNGEYTVNWRDKAKSEPLSSHWAVNNRNPVDCLYGCNPSPPESDPYSSTQKNKIWFHSTVGNSGRIAPRTSTGCIIIVPSGHGENGWNEFNDQLRNVSSFHFVLNRTVNVPRQQFKKYPKRDSIKDLQYNVPWLWLHH